MNSMNAVTVNGVVHGKTIELDRDPGLPEGQSVTVTMQPAGGQPVSEQVRARRRLGGLAGSVTYMAADFDAPLDDFREYME
jgi:hypothetical protein